MVARLRLRINELDSNLEVGLGMPRRIAAHHLHEAGAPAVLGCSELMLTLTGILLHLHRLLHLHPVTTTSRKRKTTLVIRMRMAILVPCPFLLVNNVHTVLPPSSNLLCMASRDMASNPFGGHILVVPTHVEFALSVLATPNAL